MRPTKDVAINIKTTTDRKKALLKLAEIKRLCLTDVVELAIDRLLKKELPR